MRQAIQFSAAALAALLAWPAEGLAGDHTALVVQRPASLAGSANGAEQEARMDSQPPAAVVDTEPPSPAPGPSTTPAPPEPMPDGARTSGPSKRGEGSLRRRGRVEPGKIPHRGLILEGKLGTVGCTGTICRHGSAHDASPGLRVDGFLGGNIAGFFEVGVQGGWGKPRAAVAPGQNVLSLYGVDPTVLGVALAEVDRGLAAQLPRLVVREAETTTAQVGPSLRLHLVPRGRLIAFLGTGIGYNLFRARYTTDGGDVRLDFHGLVVPVEGGLGVHLTRHLAIATEGSYLWTRYGLVVLDHSAEHTVVPLSSVEAAASGAGVDLVRDLPRFWTVTFALRARL